MTLKNVIISCYFLSDKKSENDMRYVNIYYMNNVMYNDVILLCLLLLLSKILIVFGEIIQ